jgi:hypothetical protein
MELQDTEEIPATYKEGCPPARNNTSGVFIPSEVSGVIVVSPLLTERGDTPRPIGELIRGC